GTQEDGAWGTFAWHHHVAGYLGIDPAQMRGGVTPPAVFTDPAIKKQSWRGAYGVLYHVQDGPIRLTNSDSLQSLVRPSRTPLLVTAEQWVGGEPYGSWFVPNSGPSTGTGAQV